MPRLNNRDYTIEELERLIYLSSVLAVAVVETDAMAPTLNEVRDLLSGSQFTNFEEGERKPGPIPWNFNFELMIMPETPEMRKTIEEGMRSTEVMNNIKNRFNAMVREEVNWYIDRVKYFMVKGGTNILE